MSRLNKRNDRYNRLSQKTDRVCELKDFNGDNIIDIMDIMQYGRCQKNNNQPISIRYIKNTMKTFNRGRTWKRPPNIQRNEGIYIGMDQANNTDNWYGSEFVDPITNELMVGPNTLRISGNYLSEVADDDYENLIGGFQIKLSNKIDLISWNFIISNYSDTNWMFFTEGNIIYGFNMAFGTGSDSIPFFTVGNASGDGEVYPLIDGLIWRYSNNFFDYIADTYYIQAGVPGYGTHTYNIYTANIDNYWGEFTFCLEELNSPTGTNFVNMYGSNYLPIVSIMENDENQLSVSDFPYQCENGVGCSVPYSSDDTPLQYCNYQIESQFYNLSMNPYGQFPYHQTFINQLSEVFCETAEEFYNCAGECVIYGCDNECGSNTGYDCRGICDGGTPLEQCCIHDSPIFCYDDGYVIGGCACPDGSQDCDPDPNNLLFPSSPETCNECTENECGGAMGCDGCQWIGDSINITYDLHWDQNLVGFPHTFCGPNSPNPDIFPDCNIETVVNALGWEGNLIHVIGTGDAAMYTSEHGWVGTLTEIESNSGYWFRFLEDPEPVTIEGYYTRNYYNLSRGANLITFDCMESMEVDELFELQPILGEFLYGIIGEAEAAHSPLSTGLPGFIGSLTTLIPDTGYWLITKDSYQGFVWNCGG